MLTNGVRPSNRQHPQAVFANDRILSFPLWALKKLDAQIFWCILFFAPKPTSCCQNRRPVSQFSLIHANQPGLRQVFSVRCACWFPSKQVTVVLFDVLNIEQKFTQNIFYRCGNFAAGRLILKQSSQCESFGRNCWLCNRFWFLNQYFSRNSQLFIQ